MKEYGSKNFEKKPLLTLLWLKIRKVTFLSLVTENKKVIVNV